MKFIELLHTETGEKQLAAGFALGLFMGFTPFSSLCWALYLSVLILFRFNFGATFFSYGIFKLVSFGLDPVFDRIGSHLLSSISLRSLWTSLFHTPVVPFTRFNNSIVMGSLVVASFAALPFYLLMVWAVRRYRTLVVARVKATWAWKAFKASKLVQLYEKFHVRIE